MVLNFYTQLIFMKNEYLANLFCQVEEIHQASQCCSDYCTEKKNMRLYCIVIKVQFAIISKFALGYYRFLCHCVPKKYIINNNYCYYHYYLLPASPCENKKQTSEMKLVISSHRLGDWITVNSQLDEECWCHISRWSSSLLEQFWKKNNKACWRDMTAYIMLLSWTLRWNCNNMIQFCQLKHWADWSTYYPCCEQYW